MKILDDIWASVSGTAKLRVSDPFIGTFIFSWVVCNWNHIGLLLWGEGKVSDRIDTFNKFISGSEFFAFNTIFFVPLTFAVFYVLAFPWVSLFFKFILKAVDGKLHGQAVETELEKVEKQERLNRARLKSDPDKQFLEQDLKFEIDRKLEVLEHLKERTRRIKNRADESAAALAEAEAKAAEAKSKARIVQLEESSRKKQMDLEKQRFNVNAAKLKSAMASQRLPSAYFFMSKIDESLKSDGVRLSLTAVGEVVAAIFGYKDFQAIMDDEGFNNDALSKVEYVYYDSEELASKLEGIVFGEQSANEDLTSDLLFDHVLMMFEDLPYILLDLDGLEEKCVEFFGDNRYSILDAEGVLGAIAESDTIFDDVEFDHLITVVYERGFAAKVKAYAQGHHRKDGSVQGRTMSIVVDVKSHLKVGSRALGEFEFFEASGTLDDFHEPEDETANGEFEIS
jgi:hypothetical protein